VFNEVQQDAAFLFPFFIINLTSFRDMRYFYRDIYRMGFYFSKFFYLQQSYAKHICITS